MKANAKAKSKKTKAKKAKAASKVRLPQPKRGTLTIFGYSAKSSELARHKALLRAVRALNAQGKDGLLSAQRKLQLVATFNKNKNPRMYVIFRKDAAWLRSLRMYAMGK